MLFWRKCNKYNMATVEGMSTVAVCIYGRDWGRPVFFPLQGNCFLWKISPTHIGMGPEGVQGAIGKPPGRLRRGEILCDTGKER